MKVIDKILLEWSFRCHDGIVDLNDPIKMSILNEILDKLGINLNEVVSSDSVEGINILKDKFGFGDDNFVEKSGKTFKVLVPNKEREEYTKKISDLEGFELSKRNTVKYKSSTFEIKPKDSSESYNIKPQNVGVKGDFDYNIDNLKSDINQSLSSRNDLSEAQKKYLSQLLSGNIELTSEELAELTQDKNFINQVQKNFGEISGAIWYMNDKFDRDSTIKFPAIGNLALVDSFITTGDGDLIKVSSKAAGGGNIIKPEGLLTSADETNYQFEDKDKEFILKTINDNNVITVNRILAEKYGNDEVKQLLDKLNQALIDDPRLKQPDNRRLLYVLETTLIKQINAKFNFNDIFNDLLDIVYIKTFINPKTGEPKYSAQPSGNYKVTLRSKNTADPDRSLERIGFAMLDK
jgi:hypothetical protein